MKKVFILVVITLGLSGCSVHKELKDATDSNINLVVESGQKDKIIENLENENSSLGRNLDLSDKLLFIHQSFVNDMLACIDSVDTSLINDSFEYKIKDWENCMAQLGYINE